MNDSKRIDGRRGPLLGLITILFVSLALPSTSIADDLVSKRRSSDRKSSEFTVRGTDGYVVNVKSEEGRVEVVVSERNPPVATISADGKLRPANRGNVAAATYIAFNTPRDPNTIAADLGPCEEQTPEPLPICGAISVAFQPSGEKYVNKLDLSDKTTNCVAPSKIVRRLGTFVGTIKFRGENGYTAVDRTSVRGTVGTSPFRNCSTKPRRGSAEASSKAKHEIHGVHLSAESSRIGVVFGAFTDQNRTGFLAASFDPISDNLSVFRTAVASASDHTFIFDSALTAATLEPPAPFAGRGKYRDGPHSAPSLTGDLSVAFPGFDAPLAGDTFKAKLRFVRTGPPSS